MIDLAWLTARFPDLDDLTRLGSGGQKEVFAAVHERDGDVVLKVFHVGADRERAVRECRVSLDLADAKIPATYDVGAASSPTGEVLWVREQRIRGQNLRECLDQGPLTDDQVLRAAADLLDTLASTEELNVVHRDVKPENVIAADDGSFWLIDFGLARHLDLTSLTATGIPFGVGTPGYAPPEQFRNRKQEIDGRADLFGLGVTLYEAVEGVNPFRTNARDNLEILRRTETMALPRIMRPIAPCGAFGDFLHTVTRRRPSHRPESVAYAREWFQSILANG